MATLKDVARLANVDVSTVSRALNNKSYVHPETRKRIFDAVAKLSYHPNVLAQGLRHGKRRTIAIVVPRFADAVYADMIPAICDGARSRDYQCLICTSDDDESTEREILSRLRGGVVDGIIITSTGRNNRILKDMDAEGIHILQAIRNQEDTLSSIVADYHANAYDAVHHLYSKGCRNIGLIIGNLFIHPYMERYNGYQKAIRELGLEPVIAMAESDPSTFGYGAECTKRLLEENSAIDGILASLDIQGMGVLRTLKLMGRNVPQDIRLISLTGISLGSYLETTMTSMEVPAAEIGREAIELMIRDIESGDGKRSVKKLVFRSTLVERESS